MPTFSRLSRVYVFVISALLIFGCQQKSETAEIKSSQSSTELPKDFVSQLQKKVDEASLETKVLSTTATGINNLVWVSFDNMAPKFVTIDSLHILDGDLLKLSKGGVESAKNSFLSAIAKEKLGQLSRDETINFSPANKKATVYVFTDVDCGYCRKFHNEVESMMAKGIEVRYLAWPRSDETLPVMESVWCSTDQQSAMTASKNGMAVKNPPCNNPVQAQYGLGLAIGVKGTPAIYTEAGENIGGYLSADQLAARVLP